MSALTGAARAQVPQVDVVSTASCPGQAAVAAAVERQFRATPRAGSGLLLEVEPHSEGAIRVTLRGSDGAPQLTRVLDGRGCESLASAIAIVLDAHFVSLGMQVTPVDASPPVEQEVPRTQAAPSGPAESEPDAAPSSRAAEAPRSRDPARLQLGLGGLLNVYPEFSKVAPGGLLSLDWAWRALRLGIVAHGAGTIALSNSPVVVDRADFGLGARVALPGWPSGVLFPTLGAGVVCGWGQVDSLPAGHSAVSCGPELNGGLLALWNRPKSPDFWALGSVRYLPVQDRYRAAPYGEVAQGPTWMVQFALGIDFEIVKFR